MSTVISTDILDTATREKKSSQRKQENKSFLDKLNLKGKYEKHKLEKIWAWRNYDHGDVFANSLEVDFITFSQHIFIEETQELVSKLKRIGFEIQADYPNESSFKHFSFVMYHKKHNIAISLYQPKCKQAIKTAYNIMEKTKFDGEAGMMIFLSAVDVLINK